MIPETQVLRGFDAVHITHNPDHDPAPFLETALRACPTAPSTWEVRGAERGGRIIIEHTTDRGVAGAVTIHHVSFTTPDAEMDAWRDHLARTAQTTPTAVVDRYYQRCVCFREPGGSLFELSTDGPGFLLDEPRETLALPPRLRPYREQIAHRLRPLPDVTRDRRPA